MSLFDDLIRNLFGGEHPLDEQPMQARGDVQLPTPIHRKVLAITHNPKLTSKGGANLKEFFRWNDPYWLAREYANDIREISYGYANYEVVEHLMIDAYPIKRDGFRYTEKSYLDAWATRKFHDPDGVDYLELVREFDMIRRIESEEIDEVWLFGHPYGGYYESIMCGRGAFWCNAPPLQGTEQCQRKFVIMGFNFERGVGEMLENLGHRAESMLYKVYERSDPQANLFEKFTRYDKTHPSKAECGNVHFAPNSVRDYDWGNPSRVPSRCDTWLNFPDLSGEPRIVTCNDWGGGDIRAHHKWWFARFPHIVGETKGISWNWWDYVIDPNRVKV
jgi:hypothetical protein